MRAMVATPILDEAKKSLSTPTPKMQALIETMFLAAHADEDFGPKEREQFVSSVVGVCGGKLKSEDVARVVETLEANVHARGQRLLSIAGRLPRAEDREHALALACAIVLADAVLLEE